MSSLSLARRTLPTGAMGTRLPPLRSVATGGGVSPMARPRLKAPNGFGSLTMSPMPGGGEPSGALDRVAPNNPIESGWGVESNLAARGMGTEGVIPHSVWAGQYANEEQSIVANAQEQAQLLKERAIAGGYANSGYFLNQVKKLGAQTNALLARARRAVNAQEAQAMREDRWRLQSTMRSRAPGIMGGGRGGAGIVPAEAQVRAAPIAPGLPAGEQDWENFQGDFSGTQAANAAAIENPDFELG